MGSGSDDYRLALRIQAQSPAATDFTSYAVGLARNEAVVRFIGLLSRRAVNCDNLLLELGGVIYELDDQIEVESDSPFVEVRSEFRHVPPPHAEPPL